MIEYQSFCSNELLTGISILSVLSNTKELEAAKCILIEPMLNHKDLRDILKKSNTVVRSIEELILKKTVAFSNFNNRFHETLPLSVNSILLMSELGLIRINDKMISFFGYDFNFNEESLGKSAKERIIARKKVAEILQKETVANLYLNLQGGVVVCYFISRRLCFG